MRRVVAGFIVVAVLVSAAVVVVRLRDRDRPAAGAATEEYRGGTQPAASVVPVGGPADTATAEQARRAGIEAVAQTGEVLRAGFISRRELIATFATPSYGPTLADETSSAMASMLIELGQRDVDTRSISIVEIPIAATAEASSSTAIVRVWSVLVVALPAAKLSRQAWRTVTLDMVLVDGRWLVDNWSSSPGPTPPLPPRTFGDDAGLVAGPLAWPPAHDLAVA